MSAQSPQELGEAPWSRVPLRSCLPDPGPDGLARRLRSPWIAAAAVVVTFAAGAQTAAWTGYGGPGGARDAGPAATRADSVAELREALSLYRFEAERFQSIVEKSADYRIPADLAREVHDTAREVGLDPEIAFRMVEIESAFRRRAVSSAGAVGLTQIKPSTARWLMPSVTRRELFDTRINLRLGFRYLRVLLDRYDGDVRLALLAYNRGPTRVGSDLAMGRDPSNGYARSVMATPER